MGGYGQSVANAAMAGLQQGRAQKQDLQDQAHQVQIGQYQQAMAGYQQKMSTLDPNSAEFAQARNGHAQVMQQLTDYLHPAKNPGLLEKLHLAHAQAQQASTPPHVDQAAAAPLPETQSMPTANVPSMPLAGPMLPEGEAFNVQGPQTPGSLKSQAQANLLAGSVPSTYTPPLLTREQEQQAALVKAGIAPKAVAPKEPVGAEQLLPEGAPYKAADGTYHQAYRNKMTGAISEQAMPAGYTGPAAKPATPSKAGQELYIRSLFPKTIAAGKELTAEQRAYGIARYKQLMTPDTQASHGAIGYDADGNPVPFSLQSSSHKNFGAGAMPADGAAPPDGPADDLAPRQPSATPGRIRRDKSTGKPSSTAQSGASDAAPVANRGDAISRLHKNTKDQNDATADHTKAVKLASYADSISAKPSGVQKAVEQRNFVQRLSKESAGRFQAFEYTLQTQNLGWKTQLDRMLKGVTTGELPDEVWQGLVAITKDEEKASRDAKDNAYSKSNKAGSGTGGLTDDQFLIKLGGK